MKIISAFKTKYPWIFKSLIITPVIALLVIPMALGEGKINPFFFYLFYPYTFFAMAGFQIEDERMLEDILFIGFLLYITYGVILTFSERKGIAKETLRVLIIAHVTAALFCIILL